MSEISELRAIQKEQLRIRKEIYETKEILKATFGKKWSIKLESIELLRHTRELGKEIGLLRKQLARMLGGAEREKSIAGVTVVLNSDVADQVTKTETPAGEKSKKSTWVPTFHYDKNNAAGNGISSATELSARDKFTVSFVDKAATGIAGIALGSLASSATLAASAASALSLSFVPLVPVVGLVASELTKVYLEHQEKLENLGSVMEQQSLYIETMFRSINPKIGDEEAKLKSEIFMRLVRDNSAETGFDQNDVMTAGGMVAANITGISIEEAMGYVRFAEDIAALNHGSTATETMTALMEAKNGNMDAVQRYLPGVNLSEYKPEEFEGKVMPMLMKLYKGGVEKRLQTAEGHEARNEMIKLKNIQDDVLKKEQIKKNAEIWENSLETNRLPIKHGDIAEMRRYDRLGSNTNGIAELPPIKIDESFSQLTRDRLQQSTQNINTQSMKNQNVTINITGTNLTPQDIYNKVAVPLKMAIANMSSQLNPNARFGGVQA